MNLFRNKGRNPYTPKAGSMTKSILLAVAIPLTFSSVYAKVQVIPKAEIIVKEVAQNKSQYVLKNAKGTHLQTSILSQITPENWFNLSPADGAEGVSTEEVYKSFGVAQSEDIVVAVIDSGVDVNHEDLQGKIWINQGEIPDNGIDDDNNGYIDDVFGWNFIGGADGMAKIVPDDSLSNGLRLIKGKPEAQVDGDTLEITRELISIKALKASLESRGETLSASLSAYLTKLETEVNANVNQAVKVVKDYEAHLKNYKAAVEILKEAGLSTITLESVRAFEASTSKVQMAKAALVNLLANGLTEDRINKVLSYYRDQKDIYYNLDVTKDARKRVGDNYADQTEKFYGNNDVIGPDSSHGTHVSGSIAAVRDNNIGIKGVATNVKIMAIRVVPNGDERDKDVANGIRYAVDNGAKIINMSFGKAYSPYKKVVDDAMRYAEEKGVLLVHAAGNSNQNNDFAPNFPNRNDLAKKKEFSNWLEIGASSFQKGLNLPADFSNYGKKSVDFFAPGVDILSTTPDNTYDTYSGTSMAAPTASGVAALALSFAPSMDAAAVRSLLIDTSRRYPTLKVNLPGTETPVLFSSLSIYGTVTDALEAVQAIR